jgi:Ni/Fe-hydrogenase subunit HybB-like protein
MSAHAKAQPVGGPIWTRGFRVVTALFAVSAVLMVWRWIVGLGAATDLSDGYPWGLWIAFDVVTGTALGCGGYAMAFLVYIFNKGQYHPLVRPAVLTSALGYTMAALAINLDVGRPLYIYKIPVMPHWWNLNSALLEVAVCVMSYVAVLWIELSPAFFERWEAGPDGFFKKLSATFHPIVKKLMVPLLAVGILLPTMHQSSLGALMLLAGPKLHGLWHTPLLPLLFLISCVGMGYAVVAFEGTLAARVFRRPRETTMLASLGRVTGGVVMCWAVLRFLDIVLRGKAGLLFSFDMYGFFFWLEMVLSIVGALILLTSYRHRESGQFVASMLIVTSGALYRFSTYLIAYNPGPNWSYFPSVPEQIITFGVVALEIMLYVILVKTFPILSGSASARAAK